MSTNPWAVCDEDHGIGSLTYDSMRALVNALWYALYAVWEMYDWMQELLGVFKLRMPSGLVIDLISNGELVDFKLPKKRFWAVQLTVAGMFEFKIPLPRYRWDGGVSPNWWNQLTNIPGSTNWKYKDEETGDIKYGYEFDPPRGYNIMFDLEQDMVPIGVMIAIIYLLTKLNLFKAIPKFLSFLGHVNTNVNVRQTEDIVTDLETRLRWITPDPSKEAGELPGGWSDEENVYYDVQSLLNEVSDNKQLLQEIKSLIGLRLTL